MHKVKIEVCAYSVRSAITAQEAGAYRVELCSNYFEGGTTPSYGTIEQAREALNIKLHVIIRPRGGDFLYNNTEYKTILKDIEAVKKLGADGIAIGVLTAGGNVDTAAMKEIIAASGNMSVTFHRAFDTAEDPYKALDDLMELGVNRILTSGLKSTAVEGKDIIAGLVEKAKGRIIIMPGSGVNRSNIENLYKSTGAVEYHLSGRVVVKSGMQFHNEEVSFNPELQGGDYYETDFDKIKSVIDIVKEL
jgi:copper homeostasis protein